MPPFDRIVTFLLVQILFVMTFVLFVTSCGRVRRLQFLVALGSGPAMATEEASLRATREEMARIISALSGSDGNGLLEQIEGMSKRRRAEIDEEVRFCSPPPLCI